MKSNRTLVFQRIHPVNFCVAYFMSFLCSVAFWRSDMVPRQWLRRLRCVDPSDLFDLDDWQSAQAEVYKKWGDIYDEKNNFFHLRRYVSGLKVDFSKNMAQWLAIKFEEGMLFNELLVKLNKTGEVQYEIASTSLFSFSEFVVPLEFPLEKKWMHRFLNLLDKTWELMFSVAVGFQQMSFLFKSGCPHDLKKQVDCLWFGISPVELAAADNKLDFSFLVNRNLINAENVLYFLPVKPQACCEERLRDSKVQWMLTSSYAFLPRRYRFKASLDIVRCLFVEVFSFSNAHQKALAMRYVIQTIPWFYISRMLKPKIYLTTVSACWPENAVVALMNASGVRTVNWSYGANTFLYSIETPDFVDVGVARSISVAQEILVWNKWVKEWLILRGDYNPSSIHLTGPLMCGDSRWINISPVMARAKYFKKKFQDDQVFLSFFDVPPVPKETRLRIGHGPSMYPLVMLENFYKDIFSLLKQYDNLVLVMKPKRSLSDVNREYPDSLMEMITPDSDEVRSGRILLLEHDVDPYIPIGVADICIGMPFTSPVFAAMDSGRQGMFYDPTSTVRHFLPEELLSSLIHGKDNLSKWLDSAMVRRMLDYSPDEFIEPLELFSRFIIDADK